MRHNRHVLSQIVRRKDCVAEHCCLGEPPARGRGRSDSETGHAGREPNASGPPVFNFFVARLGMGWLGLPKGWSIAAFGQIDHNNVQGAFGGIILAQARAKPRHLATHGGIDFGIVVRAAAVYFDANQRFFESLPIPSRCRSTRKRRSRDRPSLRVKQSLERTRSSSSRGVGPLPCVFAIPSGKTLSLERSVDVVQHFRNSNRLPFPPKRPQDGQSPLDRKLEDLRFRMRFGCPVFKLTLAVAVSAHAFSQTYSIKTFAGGALPVNIAGTSASLGHIGGIAVDQHGNVFITVPEYDVVVRWDPTTKGLTLVAGNGSGAARPGLPGDNGPATGAQLFGDSGVAVDPAGTFYIADNAVGVRKVSGGVITTLAGVSGPTVAVDPFGNLYVAGGNVIRKVSNGVVTMVAGNGTDGFSGDNGPATSAQLNGASGLAVDSAGNLYIADTNNNVIRKVSGGVITTIAGNGTSGYSGDNGPATSAQLKSPYGLAVDPTGNLFIADTNNNVIRKVSSGVITTVAGGGSFNSSASASPSCAPWPGGFVPFSSVYALTSPDEAGNRLLVGDATANYKAIQNLPLPTAPDQLFCGAIQLANGFTVQAYVPTAAERQGDFNGFSAFIIDPHTNQPIIGNVLPSAYQPAVYAWRIAPVDSGDNGSATTAVLDRPFSVALDPAGNLYIADKDNARVREVSNGVITTIAGNGTCCFVGGGSATNARLHTPNGVAVDPAGNLYIADTPDLFAYGPYPTLFFSNVYGGVHIQVHEVSNGMLGSVAGAAVVRPFGGRSIAQGSSFAVDSAGNLYVADQRSTTWSLARCHTAGGHNVAGGGSSLDDGVAATAAQLNAPNGIALDSSGNLFIGDGYRVRKIANGVITTAAGNGTPRIQRRQRSGDQCTQLTL